MDEETLDHCFAPPGLSFRNPPHQPPPATRDSPVAIVPSPASQVSIPANLFLVCGHVDSVPSMVTEAAAVDDEPDADLPSVPPFLSATLLPPK